MEHADMKDVQTIELTKKKYKMLMLAGFIIASLGAVAIGVGEAYIGIWGFCIGVATFTYAKIAAWWTTG